MTLGAGLGVAGTHRWATGGRAGNSMTDEALDLIVRCAPAAVTYDGALPAEDVQIAGERSAAAPPGWTGGSSRSALCRAARGTGWIVGTSTRRNG